jgi:hypothetical protein
MKLVLTTYDCFAIWDTGYIDNPNCIDFAKNLINLAKKFAKETKVPLQTVHWIYVQDLGMLKEHLIIYAKVPKNWEITENTDVLNNTVNEMYPKSVFTLRSWINGHSIIPSDNNKNTHKLFKSI